MQLPSHFLPFQGIHTISREKCENARAVYTAEYTAALRLARARAPSILVSRGKKWIFMRLSVCTPRNAINFTQWCYVLMVFMVSATRVRKMLRRKTLRWSNTSREIPRRHISKFIFTSRDEWMMLTFSKIGWSLHTGEEGGQAFQNYCISWKALTSVYSLFESPFDISKCRRS